MVHLRGLLNHRWSVGELATLVLDTDHGYPGVGNRENFWNRMGSVCGRLDLSTRRLLLGHRLQYVTERAIFGVSETTVLQEDYSLENAASYPNFVLPDLAVSL